MRRHHYLVASSPLVADALRRDAPHAEIVVAPLSLDPAHYRPAPLDGTPTAGLIGTASWPPTAGAIRTPCARTSGHACSGKPRARSYGSRAAAPSSSGFEGEVDSAREFFQRLSLLLFPLPRGSGMKVKVLEALACGVPVVTTPAGAEGIAESDGVAVHTDPAELAASAAELLRDEGAEARARRGRAEDVRGGATRPALRPSRWSDSTGGCGPRAGAAQGHACPSSRAEGS